MKIKSKNYVLYIGKGRTSRKWRFRTFKHSQEKLVTCTSEYMAHFIIYLNGYYKIEFLQTVSSMIK